MNNDKCGIYRITCRPTGEIYVGSSSRIYRRWYEHRLLMRRGGSGCWLLQKAWTKYGEDAFWFEVIEECAAEDLEFREQFHINALQPELNVITDLSVGSRALALAANKIRWAAITHCPYGHLYDEANTYIGKKGEKICRACNALRVSAIYATETVEEREKRRAAVKASREKNLAARLAKEREYASARKAEKAEYDRQHRAEHTKRNRERIRNQAREEHALHLKKKRISYHRGRGRGDVDTSLRFSGEMLSEESRAKTSASLKKYYEQNPKPRNEPWVAERISKTTYYRRIRNADEDIRGIRGRSGAVSEAAALPQPGSRRSA